MSPLLRSVAVGVVERLGEAALPAWRDMAAAPCVGPHARAVLAGWDQGPEPSDADWEWLGVEHAAAALEDKGPDEALIRVWESMPGADLDTCLAAVQATSHPVAGALVRAVAEFAAVGLEGTGDEDAVRVRDAVAPGGKIMYTYDLGACWEHEITLEQRRARRSRCDSHYRPVRAAAPPAGRQDRGGPVRG